MGYDSLTHTNLEYIAPRAGYRDVIVHGTNEGYFLPGRRNAAGEDFPPGQVNPFHIVDAIRNNPNYHGEPIRLISCHSGYVLEEVAEIPAAQRVANELGVPVTAPTTRVGILFRRGRGQVPVVFDGGYWRTFLPLLP
ncbi:hypothetical protein HUT19_07960 [Streptomyces sp. NA02950]|nr:hypothetical protein HUT19_07960 [Streptomyces sp. NA02950]